MKKQPFDSKIYAFDIETYNGYMYLGCIMSGTITYTDKFKIINLEKHFFRRWNDIESFMLKLAKSKERSLMYIQNFSYEWSYMLPNMPRLMQWVSQDEKGYLFTAEHSPLYITFGNLQIRDSLRLFNRSIESCGLQLGEDLNKLKYDYDIERHYDTAMTAHDYDYNSRDCEILLKYIPIVMNSWSWIQSIDDIPYTFTGQYRKNNLKCEDINTKTAAGKTLDRSWSCICRQTTPIYKDDEGKAHIDLKGIQEQEDTYAGGWVHANGRFACSIVYDVDTFDFKSSYPAIPFTRYMPAGKPTRVKTKTQRKALISRVLKYNHSKPKPYISIDGFYGLFIFTNLQAIDKCHTTIPVISCSKCLNGGELLRRYKSHAGEVIIDNGRIEKAPLVMLWITEVDLAMIDQCYTYDIVDCDIMYSYHMERLHKYVRNAFQYYGARKVLLKNCTKGKEEAIKEAIKIGFSAGSDWEYELMKSKNGLNGQYGIHVQKLIQPNYRFTGTEVQAGEADDSLAKNLNHSFLIGLYFTAWARYNIVLFSIHAIESQKATVYYWDTDSCKCKCKDPEKLVTDWNDYTKKLKEDCLRGSKEGYDFGQMEWEKHYDKFITLGCKRYMYQEGKSIHATVSGLPRATEKYTELLQICNGSFEDLVNSFFHLGTIFDETASGKLYSDYKYAGQYSEREKSYSGVLLRPIQVEMRYIVGDNKHTDYYEYLTKELKRDIHIKKTIISKGVNGLYEKV